MSLNNTTDIYLFELYFKVVLLSLEFFLHIIYLFLNELIYKCQVS